MNSLQKLLAFINTISRVKFHSLEDFLIFIHLQSATFVYSKFCNLLSIYLYAIMCAYLMHKPNSRVNTKKLILLASLLKESYHSGYCSFSLHGLTVPKATASKMMINYAIFLQLLNVESFL